MMTTPGRSHGYRFIRKAARLGLLAAVVLLSGQKALALDENDTMSRAEKILFGHVLADEPADARLARIEKRIFGRRKSGEKAERLDRVSSVLLLDQKPAEIPQSQPQQKAAHEPQAEFGEYGFGKKTDVKEILRQGMKAHREGRHQEADKHFRQAVLTDPRNADAYFNLGALSEQTGDLVSALSNYRAALNLSPEDSEIQEALTAVESKLGRMPELKAAAASPSPAFSRPLHAQKQEELAVTNQDQRVVEVFDQNVPQTPAAPQSGQPFQLSTSKSRAMANASQNSGQTGKKAKAILGVALSVGASYALRASGLHCPICRFGGGGGIMRGLLRGL